MALLSFIPSTDSTTTLPLHHKPNSVKNKKKNKNKTRKKTLPPPLPPPPPPPPKPSSWENFKNLLSCKSATSTPSSQAHAPSSVGKTKYTKLSSTCGSSICAVRDAVHGNTRVIHRPDSDHSYSSDSGSHNDSTTPLSSAARSVRSTAPRGGRQLMKLSGCYECHAVDVHSLTRRYPRPRSLCPCPECGEVFTKSESLEQHQAIRHAVSELGHEDSGRHIVEIIFKSSWTCMKKDNTHLGPTATVGIDGILKIHNTSRTIARFEEYRNSVKSSSLRGPHHRSAADGNELLRFHSTSLTCSLGANNSTSLCLVTNDGSNNSSHSITTTTTTTCSACTIIRYGFARAQHGLIRTTASSGRAHECCSGGGKRAMLVCRVIAGRVGRKGDVTNMEEEGSYDSLAGDVDGNLEELFVTNPRAILPCFVVIYTAAN